jgi:class 3 adenylate cyclase
MVLLCGKSNLSWSKLSTDYTPTSASHSCPASLPAAQCALPPLCLEQFPGRAVAISLAHAAHTEALAQRGARANPSAQRLLQPPDCSHRLGRRVVKFSGDAMTALFRQPSRPAMPPAALCRPPQHAPSGHSRPLRPAWPHRSGGQIGVGVGTVYAFRVGGVLERWEYVVAGDPLRQVAEAEHTAGPGETIISPETAALLASPTTPAALLPRPLTALQIAPDMNLRAAATALRGFIGAALDRRGLQGGGRAAPDEPAVRRRERTGLRRPMPRAPALSHRAKR